MNRSMMSRLTAAAVSVALLAAGLAGCGGSGDAETAEGEMIISVNNSEPQSPLVPSNTNEMGGGKVIRYLFEGLVSFDADGNQQLEVAKSITPNEDATQYTIELNEGWTFTNGEKVTASSFADAWSFAANVHNAQKQGSRMSVIQGYDELQDPSVAEDAKLSGLEVKDDYTLVVTLNQPDSVFPVQLAHQAFFPLPSAAYEDIDAFGHNPIGNGPYMLESWEPNKNIIVVPNPDYKGNRKVSNDGIEYRVYTDPEAAYADLSSGNLDVMDSVPASALETFQTDESIVAYSQSGSSYQGFIIPERLEHFGQDEEGQLRRQAISITSPLVPEYTDDLPGVENLEHNAEKAKELWDKADAISPWSGEFKIAYNADGGHKDWVDAVCNQLKNTLGIEASGDPYPTFSDIRERVTDRTITSGPYHHVGVPFRLAARLPVRRGLPDPAVCLRVRGRSRFQRRRLQERGVRCGAGGRAVADR